MNHKKTFYRKVGERFEYDGKTYEVMQVNMLKCGLCGFVGKTAKGFPICGAAYGIAGDCLSCYRDDKTSVYFKEIEK